MSSLTLSFIHVGETPDVTTKLYFTHQILLTWSTTYSGSAAIPVGGSESIRRRTASWGSVNPSCPSYSAPHCSQGRVTSPPSRFHNGHLEIRRIAVFEKQMHYLERAPANPCLKPFLKSIRRIGYTPRSSNRRRVPIVPWIAWSKRMPGLQFAKSISAPLSSRN